MFHPSSLCASFGVLNDEPIYRPDEVAAILECDIGHVYDLIRSGKLRASNISTGSKPIWRIRQSAIVAMLVANQNKLPGDEGSVGAASVAKPKPGAPGLLSSVSGSSSAEDFSARRAARKAAQKQGV